MRTTKALKKNQNAPVGNVVNEMLFEHEAPSFNDVE